MGLLDNLDKIHTTELGISRIRSNLGIKDIDVVAYCISLIQKENCKIYRKGKNWYCQIDSVLITINAYTYTIITAHKIKREE